MERTPDTRRVNSLADLRKAEGEIVARLMSLPNGGLLFLLDPVRSLADVGRAPHAARFSDARSPKAKPRRRPCVPSSGESPTPSTDNF